MPVFERVALGHLAPMLRIERAQRVSADGHLYTCLFAAGGVDLKPALAGGETAMAERVAGLWSRRADRYSEERGTTRGSGRRVEMFLIGG